MIRLDSVKLYAGADILQDLNHLAFEHQKGTKNNVITTDKLVSNCRDIAGLKGIKIDNKTNELIIEMSAKVLKDNYFELLNKDTIQQAFDNINRSGIVSIDTSRLNEIKVHSADFTQNINSDYTPQQIINSCMLITTDRYIIQPYKGNGDNRHKTGITFRGRQTSFKERMLIYDKHTELIKDKKLLSHISQPLRFASKFAGITRIEMNVCSHKKLREYCATDNGLISILNSNQQPTHRLFKKVVSDNYIQTELFTFPDDMKLYEIEKRKGRETIVKELGFDMALIRNFIEKHVGSKTNISQYMKQYKAIASELILQQPLEYNPSEVMTEFEYLLKTA